VEGYYNPTNKGPKHITKVQIHINYRKQTKLPAPPKEIKPNKLKNQPLPPTETTKRPTERE